MRIPIARFAANRSGATAIEYALIGSLISIAIIVGATYLGGQLNTLFVDVANSFGETQ